jgi:hypothetical protein
MVPFCSDFAACYFLEKGDQAGGDNKYAMMWCYAEVKKGNYAAK